MEHQKSEGYTTLKEAEKRKKEIEYKQSLGTFVVPKCTKVKELIKEYVRIYGHNEWGVATYDGNIGLINNYIIPTIGEVQLSEINNHFMEKYYTDLLKMPAVKSSRNPDGDKLITAATVHQIHKVLVLLHCRNQNQPQYILYIQFHPTSQLLFFQLNRLLAHQSKDIH